MTKIMPAEQARFQTVAFLNKEQYLVLKSYTSAMIEEAIGREHFDLLLKEHEDTPMGIRSLFRNSGMIKTLAMELRQLGYRARTDYYFNGQERPRHINFQIHIEWDLV